MNAFELTPQEAEEWYAGAMFTRKPRQWRMMYWLLSASTDWFSQTDWFATEKQLSRELVRDGKLFTGNA